MIHANNTLVLVGRLTNNPIVSQYEKNGETSTWIRFGIAVDKFDGKDGTDFFDCKAFRRKAEVIAQYFGKGDTIQILGSIHMRKYMDSDGNNRTAYDVEVEDFSFMSKRLPTGMQDNAEMSEVAAAMNEDDLPF